MKTVMIGGSFDPAHWGHLHLIHSIVCETDYTQIILVPACINHFKQHKQTAPAQDRLAMLKLAVSAYRDRYPHDSDCNIVIDDCELERGGVSYTYDTVLYLYEKYTITGKLAVAIGDDLLHGLTRWYRFDELNNLVQFIVCRRSTDEMIVAPEGTHVKVLSNTIYHDSSSEIRNAVKNLKGHSLPDDIRSMMPKSVADYVQFHKLYQS